MFVLFALFWEYWQFRRATTKCDFRGCRTIILLLTFTTFLVPDVLAEGSYFWLSRGIGLRRHPSPHISSPLSGPAADGTVVHDMEAGFSTSAAVAQGTQWL